MRNNTNNNEVQQTMRNNTNNNEDKRERKAWTYMKEVALETN